MHRSASHSGDVCPSRARRRFHVNGLITRNYSQLAWMSLNYGSREPHRSVNQLAIPMKIHSGKPEMRALIAVLALGLSIDRKSTRLNSSHIQKSRMPSSA